MLISVYKSSTQVIHCHVFLRTLQEYFFLSTVYAFNEENSRRSLWQEFIDLSPNMDDVPWIAIGDFNVVHSMHERSDWFDGMAISRGVQEFRNCLTIVGLTDLPSNGLFFTWSNKKVEGFVAKKLDMILVNSYWLQSFPDMNASFLAPEFSDHDAGGLYTQGFLG